MRSALFRTFVSLGGVCLAFSTTVFVLTFAVSRADPSQGLEGRIKVGLLFLVLGTILVGIGVLLRGVRRGSAASIRK